MCLVRHEFLCYSPISFSFCSLQGSPVLCSETVCWNTDSFRARAQSFLHKPCSPSRTKFTGLRAVKATQTNHLASSSTISPKFVFLSTLRGKWHFDNKFCWFQLTFLIYRFTFSLLRCLFRVSHRSTLKGQLPRHTVVCGTGIQHYMQYSLFMSLLPVQKGVNRKEQNTAQEELNDQ